MRRWTLAAFTFLMACPVGPLWADPAPPPAKGDEVYIAATFKGIPHPKLVSGASVTYDMSPCKKLVIKKADAKKGTWTVVDVMGNQERLEGPWLPWMFTSETECKAAVASKGEATVTKSGTTFRVADSAGAK